MAPQRTTDARKLPQQSRSRATVRALLDACAQILVEAGYEAVTTTRVADRAGVSVGSLYQYYPGREALVAALIEEHAAQLLTELGKAFGPDMDLETGVRRFARSAVGAHRIDPALHKILTEQVPRVGRMAEAMNTSQRITEIVEGFLMDRRHEIAPDVDIHLAALVLETAVEALAHKAVLALPDLLADGVMEEQIVRIVLRYLRG
jgi:AcrR family transcriptional regulator